MPRGGSLTLSDVRGPTLIAAHGADAKGCLDLLATLSRLARPLCLG
jgi:hypothetical protein